MKAVMAGCGNMGGAMLESWLEKKVGDFTVVDPGRSDFPAAVTHHGDPSELGDARFDVVVLAVKPQIMDKVAPAYKDHLAEGGVVVSIAAGVSLDSINGWFPGAAAVRIMPNLPAQIGMGMNGLVANEAASQAHKDQIERLAKACGEALWVDDEDQLDRLTAVSGSGPGYVFHLIESYVAAAEKLGFSNEAASKLVHATMAGTVEMARRSDKGPDELRASVTSKNGTTEAGLNRLMADDEMFRRFEDTLKAAYDRARELSKGA